MLSSVLKEGTEDIFFFIKKKNNNLGRIQKKKGLNSQMNLTIKVKI